MSQLEPQLPVDFNQREVRYFRNAVERHWDPFEIDLEKDREALADFDYNDENPEVDSPEEGFEFFRQGLALFGAGEVDVTEDLAPLAVVSDDLGDQMFVTTQLYEEAKHAEFFNRYWKEVINPVEREQGFEVTSPDFDRFFVDDYNKLFDSNEEAMHRLLTDDTPENRVIAHSHYHLVIEGVIAQTGYYGFHKNCSPEVEDIPNLPGLVEGFSNIRSDEGRHVGFGIAKIKQYIEEDGVDFEVVTETVNELFEYVQGIVMDTTMEEYDFGIGRDELLEYSMNKHQERMNQISTASSDIPDVDDLVKIEG